MMKRALLALAVTTAVLLAGCVGEVQTHTDPGQTVNTPVKAQFVIALGANPTTGYAWQESHDPEMLELLEKTYREEAKQGVVGAGGIEYFRYKALKSGSTEITMAYQRAGETDVIEPKVFNINID